MGTVTVLTSDKVYQIEANSVIGASIDVDGNLILNKPGGVTVNVGGVGSPDAVVGATIDVNHHLILTTQGGGTIDAGSVGTDVDLSGLRAKINAVIAINGVDSNGTVETVTVTDDGTDTTTWKNRLVYQFKPVGGTAHNTTYLNEYGELRVVPAKATTVGARVFAKSASTDPVRDVNTPIMEWMDDPVTRTSLRGVLGDGTMVRGTVKMADCLILNASDPIPAGTPSGTLVLRTANPVPLNLNPDFESDALNWTAAGGTLTRDTAQHHTGVASGKVVATGGVAVTLTSNKGAVVAGNTYKTDAFLRCSIATTVNLNVTWYTAANAVVSTSTASVSVTANTWTRLQSTFVAPATATQASIVPTISGTPAAGVTLWTDDIYLSV